MGSDMYYFDWTATSPISQNSLNTYCEVASQYIGNPSSTHPLGQKAKERLEAERKKQEDELKAKQKAERDTVKKREHDLAEYERIKKEYNL